MSEVVVPISQVLHDFGLLPSPVRTSLRVRVRGDKSRGRLGKTQRYPCPGTVPISIILVSTFRSLFLTSVSGSRDPTPVPLRSGSLRVVLDNIPRDGISTGVRPRLYQCRDRKWDDRKTSVPQKIQFRPLELL